VAISKTVLVLAGGNWRPCRSSSACASPCGFWQGGDATARSDAEQAAGGDQVMPMWLRHCAAALDLSRFPGCGQRCLRRFVPLSVPVTHSLARDVAGAMLAAGWLFIIAMGTRRFAAAGTNVPPTLPTTALVVDGIYRRTRNPLYLGMTLVYLGLGFAAEACGRSGWLLPLLWVINVGVVKREERYLERKFGDAYRAYKGTGCGGGFDGAFGSPII